jgi:4-amino-4-deoxy-L-arabinose transferase-like glycosyltransferase
VNSLQPKKSSLSILFFLMGGVLVVSGQSLVDKYPYDKRLGMLILVAVGLLFVAFGIWTINKGLPHWLDRLLGWMSKNSIQEWQVCCVILSLPTAFVVPFAAGNDPKMISPILALSAWFLAIGLVLAGTWSRSMPLRWPAWRQVILIIGITGIAFLVRAILANRIPIVLTGDEASAGLAAEDFTRGVSNNIFVTAWYAFPSFFFTIPAFFISVLGHTTEALRIPSALAGALTVIASFFVARAMFGNRTAWFTAVFLTALHFHIHFSRIGLNNIWDGLWFMVSIGALWFGWERDRRNAYLLAGLSLGISQYFYSSSRTLFVVILSWIILAAIFDRSRLKRAWLNLLLMFIVTGIVALPLAWYYVNHPTTFMEPVNRVALTSEWLRQEVINTGVPAWRIVLKQVGLAVGSYTYEPLRAWYVPDVPLLRPLAAGLFMIGIILLLLQWQKWYIIPILLWLFTFMVIGGLSESTPAAQRYVAAAPVCALLVGFGLSESSALLEKVFENGKRWIALISIFLVAVLALDELYFYFGVYTPHSVLSMAQSNDVVAQTLADTLKTKPTDTQVIFFGSPNMGYYSIPSIEYLVPDIKGVDINQPWSSNDAAGLKSKHLIFVFLPNHLEQIPLVQADYPEGNLQSIPAADGKLLYEMYEVTSSH